MSETETEITPLAPTNESAPQGSPAPQATEQVAADEAPDIAGKSAAAPLEASVDEAAVAPQVAPAEAAAGTPASGGGAPVPSPADTAQQLKQAFPALFAGAVKPIKLRIQVDIQQRAPGKFSKQALSAFFRRHTGSTSYLIAVTKAPHRFDLDGQPAGEITAEHRQVAQEELSRRRENQQSRRDLEEQQRRNRAGLLHDYQTTTLTKANFCALKGVPVEELDGLLEIARSEAAERAQQMPARHPNPHQGRGPGPNPNGGRGAGVGGPRHDQRQPGQETRGPRGPRDSREQRDSRGPRPPGGGQPRRPR